MKKTGWILSTMFLPVLCFSECPCKNRQQPKPVPRPAVIATNPSAQMEAYITHKAPRLGLNPGDRDDRVLTRLSSFFRINTAAEVAVLKKAILTLPMEDCEKIATQFDGSEITRSALHLTTVLLNLSQNVNLGDNPSDRLTAAAIRGLPFIALILEQQRARLLHGGAVPLNFLNIADIAKREPDLLLKRSFKIDDQGNVTIP
jgi:hypothetical protein